MGLMQSAYETYVTMAGRYAGVQQTDHEILAPVAHGITRASITVTLGSEGEFISAEAVDKKEAKIIIPVTEASAGRTSGTEAHPLCDNLGYLMGTDEKKLTQYLLRLKQWADSPYSHPKLQAILTYLQAGTMADDLKRADLLEYTDKGELKNEDDLVRWRVLDTGDRAECWLDRSLMKAYAVYQLSRKQTSETVLCMLTGDKGPAAEQHIKGVVALNGNAKIISANDTSGFTFRGRFTEEQEALTIGYEASQKAHNALKWVIANEGVPIAGRTFVCWNPHGYKTPRVHMPLVPGKADRKVKPTEYREQLYQALIGFKNDLPSDERVVIAAFDAATKGRLAVTYYNELLASDLLERMYAWDESCCWWNGPYGVQSPALPRIVDYAFGTLNSKGFMECDEKLGKQQMQRLLACRLNKAPVPSDIVKALVQKCGNLQLYPSQYPKTGTREGMLSAACALLRKYRNEGMKEGWTLTLDRERMDRSYQYGRLLAILEKAERDTYDIGEKREPNAIRLQPMYVRQPAKTARNVIEMLKRAYYPRLKPGKRTMYEKEIESVYHMLSIIQDGEQEKPLDDSYLMGYYLQKEALYTGKDQNEEDKENGSADEED